MDILNIVWGGGSAFSSIHMVHSSILGFAVESSSIATVVLAEGGADVLSEVGSVIDLGLTSRRLKGKGRYALCRYFDRRVLARNIVQMQPRVLLLDGMGVASYVLPLLRGLRETQIIVVFHGRKTFKAAEIDMLHEYPVERLSLVAVSQTLADEIQEQIGRPVHDGRLALAPNVLRGALQSRETARQALGIPEQAGRVIGGVGRLVPEKGFALLVEAGAAWLREQPGDHLVIVGEGDERARLAALAQELGVSGQVHLVGHRPQASRLLLAFDLVCLPSEQEGFGLVLSEAVIAGVPVLASDLPVFREQLPGDVELLPVAQPAAWSKAIQGALKGDLSALASYQYQQLSPDASWERYSRFYRQLLAG